MHRCDFRIMRSLYALCVFNMKANIFLDCKYCCDRRLKRNNAGKYCICYGWRAGGMLASITRFFFFFFLFLQTSDLVF